MSRTTTDDGFHSSDDDDDVVVQARRAKRPRRGTNTPDSLDLTHDDSDEDETLLPALVKKRAPPSPQKSASSGAAGSPSRATSLREGQLKLDDHIDDEGKVKKPAFNEMQCPICFSSPSPLAVTACGHCFCAPCLHAALAAAPPMTPPPPAVGAAGRGAGMGFFPPVGAAIAPRGGRGGRGGGRGRGGRGRGRGGAARAPGGSDAFDLYGWPATGATLAGGALTGNDSDDEDNELNKPCPLCRAPLKGGWGKSLRGLRVKMKPIE